MRSTSIGVALVLVAATTLSANPVRDEMDFGADVTGKEAKLHFLTMHKTPGTLLLCKPDKGDKPEYHMKDLSEWRVVDAKWTAAGNTKADGGSGAMDYARYEATVKLEPGKNWYVLIHENDGYVVDTKHRLVELDPQGTHSVWAIGWQSLEPKKDEPSKGEMASAGALVAIAIAALIRRRSRA